MLTNEELQQVLDALEKIERICLIDPPHQLSLLRIAQITVAAVALVRKKLERDHAQQEPKWPYENGPAFMSPAVVWTAYVNENRLRRLWEIELAHCATRIHNQREEIARLSAVDACQAAVAAERERLAPLIDTVIMHTAGATLAGALFPYEKIDEIVPKILEMMREFKSYAAIRERATPCL